MRHCKKIFKVHQLSCVLYCSMIEQTTMDIFTSASPLITSEDFNVSLVNFTYWLCEETEISTFHRVVDILDNFFVPVIIIVGLVGNSLSLVVFTATYLRQMSSSVYLAGLALSDSVFLLTVLASWLINVNIRIFHLNGLCQLLVFCGYVSSFLSVWYVVSLTIEQCIAVQFPLKRQTLCTCRNAKLVICFLALVGVGLYSISLHTTHIDEGRCTVKGAFHHTMTVFTNVDTLVTLVVPTVLILGSNIRILIALAQFYRSNVLLSDHVWYSMVQNGFILPDDRPALHTNSTYNRLQMKVTKMMLMVSSVFLLCNIPSHVARLYSLFQPPTCTFLYTQKMLLIVYYSNFSFNFILYNMSGTLFRNELSRFAKRVMNTCGLSFRAVCCRACRGYTKKSTAFVMSCHLAVVPGTMRPGV